MLQCNPKTAKIIIRTCSITLIFLTLAYGMTDLVKKEVYQSVALLCGLYIFAASFQESLCHHPKIKKLIMFGMAFLIAFGIIIFALNRC